MSGRITESNEDKSSLGALWLSASMHAAIGAWLFSDLVSPKAPLPEPEPLVVELIFEPEPPPAVEEPPPEPPTLDLAKSPRIEIEPETEVEFEPEPEPQAPEPATLDLAEATEADATIELDPILDALADPRSEPEAPTAVSHLPPPPMKSVTAEMEAPQAPLEAPEAAIPDLAAAVPQDSGPEPPSLERIEAPVPELPVPPLPQRRPQVAQQKVEPPIDQAAADPEPIEEELAAEIEPVTEEERAAEAAEAPPPYVDRSQIGEVAPNRLLANLQALQNEDLQAELNPELWEVIRLIRAQIAECWHNDPQNPWNAAFSVDIKVAFKPDGALQTARIQEAARMVTDDRFKNYAVQARKALKVCSPFKLPGDKYEIWRSFTMRFLPRNKS